MTSEPQLTASPQLGASKSTFIAALGAPRQTRVLADQPLLAFADGQDGTVWVLFLDDCAVALHAPYGAARPHRHEVETAAHRFQAPIAGDGDATTAALTTRLLLADSGWTLALRSCLQQYLDLLATHRL